MDQRVQCPVCTLYLHSGMSLASHLDTHPKDQVIKALCSLSAKNYGSRSTTPLNSERSYRSRSRTPVTDDSGRWGNSHRNSDSDRYWRRTPSRNKSTPLSSTSRNPTPDIRIGNVSFENPHSNNNSNHGSDSFTIKSDKTQKTFGSNGQLSVSDYDPQFPFYPEQQDDTEIKFSRSSDYSAQVDNSNPIFGYNMPVMGPGIKFPPGMIPTVPRRGGDFTKVLPKQGNLLLKTNMSGMQYVSPGAKPMHVMMPTPPSFVQKNLQNNVLMTGNMAGSVPRSPMLDPKHMMPPMNPLSSHVNPLNAGAFTPGTTVVTQNSQIIYREMVHNIDGKPYMSNMPPTLGGHETVTNVAQSSSMYQNVMVVDQFGNTSCMYTTPQHLLPKPPLFNESILPCKQNMPGKTAQNVVYDAKKTLIIEVSPMSSSAPKTANVKSQNALPSQQSMNSMNKKPEKKKNVKNVIDVYQHGNSSCMYTTTQNLLPKPCSSSMLNESVPPYMQNLNKSNKTAQSVKDSNKTLIIEVSPVSSDVSISTDEECQNSQQNTKPVSKKLKKKKNDHKTISPGPSKGLKIISNVKVEVPVQNHKNMLNNAMDLPNSTDSDYPEPSITPEKILPDLDDDSPVLINDKCNQRSSANVESLTSNTFVTLKSSSNQSYKDLSPKPILVETKPDTELSDSCPVPDLICNEKPSISPCSELSEQGENSIDHTLLIPRPESSRPYQSSPSNNIDICKKPSKTQRNNAPRQNNIFVKKQKKILQIKNSKLGPPERNGQTELEAKASSSSFRKSPENFTITKNRQSSSTGETKPSLQPINIEKMKANNVDDRNEFDANTEEQSMDIEPVTPSNMTHSNQFSSSGCMVQIKEEVNSSNELSNEAVKSPAAIAPMEALRPINVVNYSNMADFDDDSNHKELLELDATSKNKQFVSMMNENYFGDNIYADYFTPDRGETFEAQKESNYVWGESSQKESEFVLPNFIHESYKIADSNGMDYTDVGAGIEKADGDGDGDKCERDSKADVLSEGEPPLNICADERMPPRGEISGQESNGDTDSHWSGMLSGVPPAEPYDLMARESWVSDGSDVEVNEKRENIEESLRFPKARMFNCAQCGGKFPSLKELRAHKALVHALPTCSNSKTSYSRLMTARAIKKEEKPYENVMAGNLSLDSKENIASALLQAYNQFEARPKVERLLNLKQIKKRRRSFLCPTCKVDFITGPAFHAHLKIHPLECLTCGKCFTRRANLALHMKTHLGIKNYKCDICEKGFITRQKLAEHHNVHTGRTPVKCTLCDDTFRRYSNMVQHRNRHHFKKKAKIRDFVCHCGLVFPSRAKLLWHKETHDEKPKACSYCSDKFVHAALLTRHVRRTHNEHFVSSQTKENVPCPICKQIYLRSKMRAHIQTHSGKRPYNCVICNKGFTTKWNLKLHRWIHLSRSAKPYKCNLCKSAFVRHAEYVAHMNSHKSVRPYTCNYCGCQFIRKYNCQRHVREHEMAKKYVCKVPECGKTFHRSYYLSEHMKVHSGVRPYSCNICGKTSSNKSNHNKHVKIHHAREPVATEA